MKIIYNFIENNIKVGLNNEKSKTDINLGQTINNIISPYCSACGGTGRCGYC